LSNAIFHGVSGVVLRPGSRLAAADESPLTRRQQEVLELRQGGLISDDLPLRVGPCSG
jgi:hypothetical protein